MVYLSCIILTDTSLKILLLYRICESEVQIWNFHFGLWKLQKNNTRVMWLCTLVKSYIIDAKDDTKRNLGLISYDILRV